MTIEKDNSDPPLAEPNKTSSESTPEFSHDEDVAYRTAYEASPHRLADRSYEEVRPAYRLGHIAAANPDTGGRSFESVEQEIQRGWTSDLRERYGEWDSVRPFARDAYVRASASVTEREAANRSLNSPENLADRVGDSVSGGMKLVSDSIEAPANQTPGGSGDRPGPDLTERRF